MKRMHHMAMTIPILLLVSLLVSSCGQEGFGTPAPSGFEPPSAVVSAKLVIGYQVYCDGESIKHIQSGADYLESLLAGRGWNVELRLLPRQMDEDTDEPYIVSAVKAELAAGNAADGYTVSGEQAAELLAAGLTRDLAAVLPEAAPALYSRYGELFQGPVTGLPTGIPQEHVSMRVLCYLQKDTAQGTRINGIEDVLSFLEDNDDAKIGCRWSDWGYNSLISVWAMGQGYYPLDYYGLMMGDFYAAFEDKQCTPVPIDNIPGFDEFIARARPLWDTGRFIDPYDTEKVAKDGVIGYIGVEQADLDMDIGFLQTRQKSGTDYLAFPLKGCATPAQKGAPAAPGQLAVLAASQRGTELAMFAQWALMDRDNYDLVCYGAAGMDYRLSGERVEHLNGGQPLTLQDFTDPDYPKAYLFNRLILFSAPAMNRLTDYAPDNAGELLLSAPRVSQPLMEYLQARNITEPNRFLFDIYTQYEQTISKRYHLLNCMEDRPNGAGLTPITMDECLEKLHAMAAETSAVVEACQEKIILLMMQEPCPNQLPRPEQ